MRYYRCETAPQGAGFQLAVNTGSQGMNGEKVRKQPLITSAGVKGRDVRHETRSEGQQQNVRQRSRRAETKGGIYIEVVKTERSEINERAQKEKTTEISLTLL